MTDLDFREAKAKAVGILAEGRTFRQTFTCVACGQVVTVNETNTLYERIRHDDCPVNPRLVSFPIEEGCGVVPDTGTTVRGLMAHDTGDHHERWTDPPLGC